VLLAVLLDRLVSERGGYPLWSWYSDWAESIEQRFNGGTRAQGLAAVFVATVPMVAGVWLAWWVLGQIVGVLQFLFGVFVLYLCIDLYRLGAAAQAVSAALENGDSAEAAAHLRELTGKETADRTDAGVARATVEAVLKQGNALVIAPIFWFIVLGPMGAVLQRMASIQDRLWGHRTERFIEFGWAAARFDDLLGWIPARITALSYAIMGSFEDALHCWRRRTGMWSDINSGPLLASGFGAMHIDVCDDTEEEDAYGNRLVAPALPVDAGHIRRVLALVWRVLLFWSAVGVLMAGVQVAGFLAR
jgi:adenosylcobinamide-phosphate synthase